VAAAFFFAPQAQALADPPTAQAPASPAAAADAAGHGVPLAKLLSATQPASQQKPGSATPSWYTVRSGDSLSAIAGHFYHNPDAWPVLYWANHSQVRWADIILTGQVLRIPVEPGRIPGPPTQLAPAAPAAPAPVTTREASPASAPAESDHAQSAPAQSAPAESDHAQSAPADSAPAQSAPADSSPVRSAPARAASSYSGGVPGGSFGQCVVARESGGQPQVMNSTGHYGLYQFSASTWAAYGGNPADFGHASVGEQNQVFATALAQGGQSNWSPYDGC
jgi:hypothetical protein